MKYLDFRSPTGRTNIAPPERQHLSRIHRPNSLPVKIVEMDYAEIELRILARAAERRESRMGPDDPMDPFDIIPKDLL